MDRNLLNIINVISIPIVIIFLIVSQLGILIGILSLLADIMFFYFLVLVYINVRVSVFDYVNSKIENNDMPIDTYSERERNSIKYLLFIGVLAIGVLSTVLLWRPGTGYFIYGLLFILISLLLSLFIDISYTIEYFASKKIRLNYTMIITTTIVLLALGAFVFVYLSNLFVFYMIFITLVFLIIAASYRIRKTVGFLKYVNSKPVNPGMELGFKIMYPLVFIAGIGTFLLGAQLGENISNSFGFYAFIIQLLIVVNLTKAIWDIS